MGHCRRFFTAFSRTICIPSLPTTNSQLPTVHCPLPNSQHLTHYSSLTLLPSSHLHPRQLSPANCQLLTSSIFFAPLRAFMSLWPSTQRTTINCHLPTAISLSLSLFAPILPTNNDQRPTVIHHPLPLCGSSST